MNKEITPGGGMEILQEEVGLCPDCGNYKGWVVERHNDEVLVMCSCDFELYRRLKEKIPNPSMICPDGTLFWRPISDHKASDGKIWHTPHFGGPPLHPRKRLDSED